MADEPQHNHRYRPVDMNPVSNSHRPTDAVPSGGPQTLTSIVHDKDRSHQRRGQRYASFRLRQDSAVTIGRARPSASNESSGGAPDVGRERI